MAVIAQAVIDLAAGHVTFTIEGLTLLKPFVDNGRLRVLAVTTAARQVDARRADHGRGGRGRLPAHRLGGHRRAGRYAAAGDRSPVCRDRQDRRDAGGSDVVRTRSASSPARSRPMPLPPWSAPSTPSWARSSAPWASRRTSIERIERIDSALIRARAGEGGRPFTVCHRSHMPGQTVGCGVCPNNGLQPRDRAGFS